MHILHLIITLLIVITTAVFLGRDRKRKTSLSQNLLYRFKKDFKSSNKYNERISERYNFALLGDPKNNLKINSWDKEYELIEKMQIHRIRLNKFGESKMNNQTYYQESEGNIFIINKDGGKFFI